MTTTPSDPPPALEALMTPDERTAAEADAARWRFGFYVVLAGLLVVLIGFVVAVFQSGEVATLFAGVCGVVGTIIGAYFGIQAGQAGKDRAEAELRRVNDMAIRMAGYADPALIDRVLGPRRG
jgi:type IV secretory pathway TrbF-like protein